MKLQFYELKIIDRGTMYEAQFALEMFGSELCMLALPSQKKTLTFDRKKMAEARGWEEAGLQLKGDFQDGTLVAAAHWLALANVVPAGRLLDVRKHRPTLDGQMRNLDWIQEKWRN